MKTRGSGGTPSPPAQKQKCNTPVQAAAVAACSPTSAPIFARFTNVSPWPRSPSSTEATATALLADGVDQFEDSGEIKLFLINLVKQVIQQRVGRRDAVTLAYLSQLILNCEAMMLREPPRR